MEMLEIVWPILLAGAISLFVILRLKSKLERITPEKITSAHTIGSYFIPFGMMLGFYIGGSVGASIGYLFGYFAYEVYSRKGESTH